MISTFAWVAHLSRGGTKLVIQALDDAIAFGIAAGMPDPGIVYPMAGDAYAAAQTWNAWLAEQPKKAKGSNVRAPAAT